MSESKRYWVVIHYETEIEAETEWEACHDICLGNTIVENATMIAKALPTEAGGGKKVIEEARIEARKKEALSIVLRQLADQTGNYSLLLDGLSSLTSQMRSQLQNLSLEQLETLSLEALNFSTLDQLQSYLDNL
jgi:hypothetical protein